MGGIGPYPISWPGHSDCLTIRTHFLGLPRLVVQYAYYLLWRNFAGGCADLLGAGLALPGANSVSTALNIRIWSFTTTSWATLAKRGGGKEGGGFRVMDVGDVSVVGVLKRLELSGCNGDAEGPGNPGAPMERQGHDDDTGDVVLPEVYLCHLQVSPCASVTDSVRTGIDACAKRQSGSLDTGHTDGESAVVGTACSESWHHSEQRPMGGCAALAASRFSCPMPPEANSLAKEVPAGSLKCRADDVGGGACPSDLTSADAPHEAEEFTGTRCQQPVTGVEEAMPLPDHFWPGGAEESRVQLTLGRDMGEGEGHDTRRAGSYACRDICTSELCTAVAAAACPRAGSGKHVKREPWCSARNTQRDFAPVLLPRKTCTVMLDPPSNLLTGTFDPHGEGPYELGAAPVSVTTRAPVEVGESDDEAGRGECEGHVHLYSDSIEGMAPAPWSLPSYVPEAGFLLLSSSDIAHADASTDAGGNNTFSEAGAHPAAEPGADTDAGFAAAESLGPGECVVSDVAVVSTCSAGRLHGRVSSARGMCAAPLRDHDEEAAEVNHTLVKAITVQQQGDAHAHEDPVRISLDGCQVQVKSGMHRTTTTCHELDCVRAPGPIGAGQGLAALMDRIVELQADLVSGDAEARVSMTQVQVPAEALSFGAHEEGNDDHCHRHCQIDDPPSGAHPTHLLLRGGKMGELDMSVAGDGSTFSEAVLPAVTQCVIRLEPPSPRSRGECGSPMTSRTRSSTKSLVLPSNRTISGGGAGLESQGLEPGRRDQTASPESAEDGLEGGVCTAQGHVQGLSSSSAHSFVSSASQEEDDTEAGGSNAPELCLAGHLMPRPDASREQDDMVTSGCEVKGFGVLRHIAASAEDAAAADDERASQAPAAAATSCGSDGKAHVGSSTVEEGDAMVASLCSRPANLRKLDEQSRVQQCGAQPADGNTHQEVSLETAPRRRLQLGCVPVMPWAAAIDAQCVRLSPVTPPYQRQLEANGDSNHTSALSRPIAADMGTKRTIVVPSADSDRQVKHGEPETASSRWENSGRMKSTEHPPGQHCISNVHDGQVEQANSSASRSIASTSSDQSATLPSFPFIGMRNGRCLSDVEAESRGARRLDPEMLLSDGTTSGLDVCHGDKQVGRRTPADPNTDHGSPGDEGVDALSTAEWPSRLLYKLCDASGTGMHTSHMGTNGASSVHASFDSKDDGTNDGFQGTSRGRVSASSAIIGMAVTEQKSRVDHRHPQSMGGMHIASPISHHTDECETEQNRVEPVVGHGTVSAHTDLCHEGDALQVEWLISYPGVSLGSADRQAVGAEWCASEETHSTLEMALLHQDVSATTRVELQKERRTSRDRLTTSPSLLPGCEQQAMHGDVLHEDQLTATQVVEESLSGAPPFSVRWCSQKHDDAQDAASASEYDLGVVGTRCQPAWSMALPPERSTSAPLLCSDNLQPHDKAASLSSLLGTSPPRDDASALTAGRRRPHSPRVSADGAPTRPHTLMLHEVHSASVESSTHAHQCRAPPQHDSDAGLVQLLPVPPAACHGLVLEPPPTPQALPVVRQDVLTSMLDQPSLGFRVYAARTEGRPISLPPPGLPPDSLRHGRVDVSVDDVHPSIRGLETAPADSNRAVMPGEGLRQPQDDVQVIFKPKLLSPPMSEPTRASMTLLSSRRIHVDEPASIQGAQASGDQADGLDPSPREHSSPPSPLSAARPDPIPVNETLRESLSGKFRKSIHLVIEGNQGKEDKSLGSATSPIDSDAREHKMDKRDKRRGPTGDRVVISAEMHKAIRQKATAAKQARAGLLSPVGGQASSVWGPMTRAAPGGPEVEDLVNSYVELVCQDLQNKGQGGGGGAAVGEEAQEERSRFYIAPDSSFRVRWDVLMVCLIAWTSYSMPYRMAFGTAQDLPYRLLDTVIDIIFLTDCGLNFLTGYKDVSGVVITNLEVIRHRYIRTWFILDLLTSVPLDWVASGGLNHSTISLSIRAIRLLKLLRVIRFLRLANSKEASLYLTPSMIRLVNTILLLFWVWHVIACSYWYIATWEGLGSTAWTPDTVQYMNSRVLNYLLSVQWTLQTTFSFGPPALPETYVEAIFTIFSVLIGIFMNAYVIGSAGSALQSLDAEKIQQRQQLDRIITYMKRRRLPSYFQRIILDYYSWFGEKSSQDAILADLPEMIQQRLSLLLNRDIIKDIPVLRQIDFESILDIMQNLRSQTYMPGEFVYKENEPGEFLYFVKSGQLEVLLPDHKTVVMSLLRGDICGQDALTEGEKHRAHVRAVVYSELLLLEALTYHRLAQNSTKFQEMVENEAIKEGSMMTRAEKNINKYSKIYKMGAAGGGNEDEYQRPPTPDKKELLAKVAGILFKK